MAGMLSRWLQARRRRRAASSVPAVEEQPAPATAVAAPPVDLTPDDPALAHFRAAGAPVDLDDVTFDSPGVRSLRAAGVRLVVPLVAQGELIGLINLGPRLSEQDYTRDDRKLLESLATQAAPALRVAQLVREQEREAAERERIAQELEVATLIQQNFLPRDLPEPRGWDVGAFYRPAREVGGDFYDFVPLGERRMGVFVGDVTDKGVPAALVMSATRAVLRAAAQRLDEPGAVLRRVNDQVQPDMPERMFVTCLYGVLDLDSGRFVFANAGHNLPCVGGDDGAREVRATGMPLGMMPELDYEQAELVLEPGETLVLYSDALPEAHSPTGQMYGFPRFVEQVGIGPRGVGLIDHLLADLQGFTGVDWEQEDDITLVTIGRGVPVDVRTNGRGEITRELVASFSVPSAPGNERLAVDRLEDVLARLPLSTRRRDRLRTAVAETTMNAIEHGNDNRPELHVDVEVFQEPSALLIRVSDTGGGSKVSMVDIERPDLEAKLRGEEPPRGWGLFLVKNMVDDLNVFVDDDRRTVELVMALHEEDHDG